MEIPQNMEQEGLPLDYFERLNPHNTKETEDHLLKPQIPLTKALFEISINPGKVTELTQQEEAIGFEIDGEFIQTGAIYRPKLGDELPRTKEDMEENGFISVQQNLAGLCGGKYPRSAKDDGEYYDIFSKRAEITENFKKYIADNAESLDFGAFQDVPFDEDLFRYLSDLGFTVVVQTNKTEREGDLKYKDVDSVLMTIINTKRLGEVDLKVNVMGAYQDDGDDRYNGPTNWANTYGYTDGSKNPMIDMLFVGQVLSTEFNVNGKSMQINNLYNSPCSSWEARLKTTESLRNLGLNKDEVFVLGDMNTYGIDMNRKILGQPAFPGRVVKDGLYPQVVVGNNINNTKEVIEHAQALAGHGIKVANLQNLQPTISRRLPGLSNISRSRGNFGFVLDLFAAKSGEVDLKIIENGISDHKVVIAHTKKTNDKIDYGKLLDSRYEENIDLKRKLVASSILLAAGVVAGIGAVVYSLRRRNR